MAAGSMGWDCMGLDWIGSSNLDGMGREGGREGGVKGCAREIDDEPGMKN
jgi:hypothetical protein